MLLLLTYSVVCCEEVYPKNNTILTTNKNISIEKIDDIYELRFSDEIMKDVKQVKLVIYTNDGDHVFEGILQSQSLLRDNTKKAFYICLAKGFRKKSRIICAIGETDYIVFLEQKQTEETKTIK